MLVASACGQHDAQPEGQPQSESIHGRLEIRSCDQLAHHELPRCLGMRFVLASPLRAQHEVTRVHLADQFA